VSDIELPLLTRRVASAARIDGEAALTLDQRLRSRQRIKLDDGREAGIMLPHGETLTDGDLLVSADGLVVRVRAAREAVSTATSDDALLLARACYHLGNRHVPLQIDRGRLRWRHDHVLDDLVRRLGLPVAVEQLAFEPEPGAYGGDGRGHRHEGGPGHGHGHH
jgi:urease accessory protein